jgi:predicted type IV restriction endonuclease
MIFKGELSMTTVMIPVASDVVARLLTLRRSECESLGEILRRVAPEAKKPVMSAERAKAATPSTNAVSYELVGEAHVASDATEAMINIIGDLAQYDDDFFPKLAEKVRGRTRNHVARSRSEVYPSRPDLARYVKEVGLGWFIGCNIANREKNKILRAACEVMGLNFDRDLKINLAHA